MNPDTLFDGQRVVLSAHDDRIAILRLSNPPEGFMDEHGERELALALDAVDASPALRVVIVTGGQQGVFVRHYDVRELEQRARAMAARGLRFSTDRPVPEAGIHRCIGRMEASARIFVAGINGAAMGGGYEIALGCDLRVAQDGDYRIGLPETNIGLLPGAGGTQRLAQLGGAARALEWMLLGRTFTPREAAAAGLVSECCEGPVLARCLALADDLAARHPLALAHVKRLVRRGSAAVSQAGLADERTLFCDLMVSQRTIDEMTAFNASGRSIAERGR
jgi:enoyl-CoA hydratase/carnithine racemase